MMPEVVSNYGTTLKLHASRFGTAEVNALIARIESNDAPPLVALDIELQRVGECAEQLMRSLPPSVKSLRIDRTGVGEELMIKCAAALAASNSRVEELTITGGKNVHGEWLKLLLNDNAFQNSIPLRPLATQTKLSCLRHFTLSNCTVRKGHMQPLLKDLANLVCCTCSLEALTLEAIGINRNAMAKNNYGCWSVMSQAARYLRHFSLQGNPIGQGTGTPYIWQCYCLRTEGHDQHHLSLRNTQLGGNKSAAEIAWLFGATEGPPIVTIDIRDNAIGLPAADAIARAIQSGPASVQHLLVSEPYQFLADALRRRRAARLMGLFRVVAVLNGKLWNARKKKAEERYHPLRKRARGEFEI